MANAKKTSELILGGVRKQFKEAMDVGKDLAKEWSKSSKIKSASKIKNKAIENAKELIDDVKIPSFDKWVKGDDLSKAAQSRAPKKLFASANNTAKTSESAILKKRDELISKNRETANRLREKFGTIADTSRVGTVAKQENATLTRELRKERRRQRKLNDMVGSKSLEEELYNSRQLDLESAFSSSSFGEYQKKNKVDADSLKMRDLKSGITGSIGKKKAASQGINFDKNSFAYKAAGLGVGGAIVFSMANNKGQQSNSQLYGQG